MIAISYAADATALLALSPIIEVFGHQVLVAYDPQTDALIDAADVSTAQRSFSGTQMAVAWLLHAQGETIIHPVSPGPRTPWWKFW